MDPDGNISGLSEQGKQVTEDSGDMQLVGKQGTISVSRVIESKRPHVWRMWTDPQDLRHWWWPERFHTTYAVDLREGGRYHFETVDLPDLGVLCLTGVYREISPPTRLMYTWQWERGEEAATQVTVEFTEQGDQTMVHITQEGFATDLECENHKVGWNDCLDRLQRASRLH